MRKATIKEKKRYSNTQKGYVEIIPEEYDLHKNTIVPSEKIYSSDDKNYYSPGRTYKQVQQKEPKQFEIPVIIKNLDLEFFFSTHSRKEVEDHLIEVEKELANLLLFAEGHKYVNGNLTINEHYPYAYYDPTYDEKVVKVKKLKDEIVEIKTKLGMPTDVEFFVTVKNSTYPSSSEEMLKHLNESYSVLNKHYTPPKVINGNFSQIEDVYNIRKVYFQNGKVSPYGNLVDLKNGNHNQILENMIRHQWELSHKINATRITVVDRSLENKPNEKIGNETLNRITENGNESEAEIDEDEIDEDEINEDDLDEDDADSDEDDDEED